MLRLIKSVIHGAGSFFIPCGRVFRRVEPLLLSVKSSDDWNYVGSDVSRAIDKWKSNGRAKEQKNASQ
jgi:hypothetical protein